MAIFVQKKATNGEHRAGVRPTLLDMIPTARRAKAARERHGSTPKPATPCRGRNVFMNSKTFNGVTAIATFRSAARNIRDCMTGSPRSAGKSAWAKCPRPTSSGWNGWDSTGDSGGSRRGSGISTGSSPSTGPMAISRFRREPPPPACGPGRTSSAGSTGWTCCRPATGSGWRRRGFPGRCPGLFGSMLGAEIYRLMEFRPDERPFPRALQAGRPGFVCLDN